MLTESELKIVPNYWNVCKNCKKQFLTLFKPQVCIRCFSSSLERRKYREPKVELSKLNKKVIIVKDAKTVLSNPDTLTECRKLYDPSPQKERQVVIADGEWNAMKLKQANPNLEVLVPRS